MQQSATGGNKLGFWALMFSISGVTCLPFLGSIVGLVTGIMAVRREPRGLAIAAIVISTIGGCLVPLVAAPLLVLFPALAKARATATRMRQGIDVGTVVDSFHTRKGRMPQDLAEAYGAASSVPLDEWGTALQLAIDPPSNESDPDGSGRNLFVNYRIIGSCKDKLWGTSDDQVFHQGMAFRNGSTPSADGSESESATDDATDDGRADQPAGGGTGDASGSDAPSVSVGETR